MYKSSSISSHTTWSRLSDKIASKIWEWRLVVAVKFDIDFDFDSDFDKDSDEDEDGDPTGEDFVGVDVEDMGEFDDEDAVDESEIDEEDKDAFDAISSRESDTGEDDIGNTFLGGIFSFNCVSTLQSTPLSLIIYEYGGFSITIQSFDDYSRFWNWGVVMANNRINRMNQSSYWLNAIVRNNPPPDRFGDYLPDYYTSETSFSHLDVRLWYNQILIRSTCSNF